MANTELLAERLSDLERTVQRLNLHISYLENRLSHTQGAGRGLWQGSIWPRMTWRRGDAEGKNRPIRENIRKHDHAIHPR